MCALVNWGGRIRTDDRLTLVSSGSRYQGCLSSQSAPQTVGPGFPTSLMTTMNPIAIIAAESIVWCLSRLLVNSGTMVLSAPLDLWRLQGRLFRANRGPIRGRSSAVRPREECPVLKPGCRPSCPVGGHRDITVKSMDTSHSQWPRVGHLTTCDSGPDRTSEDSKATASKPGKSIGG